MKASISKRKHSYQGFVDSIRIIVWIWSVGSKGEAVAKNGEEDQKFKWPVKWLMLRKKSSDIHTSINHT